MDNRCWQGLRNRGNPLHFSFLVGSHGTCTKRTHFVRIWWGTRTYNIHFSERPQGDAQCSLIGLGVWVSVCVKTDLLCSGNLVVINSSHYVWYWPSSPSYWQTHSSDENTVAFTHPQQFPNLWPWPLTYDLDHLIHLWYLSRYIHTPNFKHLMLNSSAVKVLTHRHTLTRLIL